MNPSTIVIVDISSSFSLLLLLLIKGDDQTPLLTSELGSTIKNSSKRTTRKYSLNALLPLVRPSNSHPVCSPLTATTTIANGKINAVDLKTRRRVSLSSALRRLSFANQIDENNIPTKTNQNELFMQKIERFRFIDDSASSTSASVTSPNELIENQRTSSKEEINSFIDRFDSDIFIDETYSDFNLLSRTTSTSNRSRPNSFQPVNNRVNLRFFS